MGTAMLVAAIHAAVAAAAAGGAGAHPAPRRPLLIADLPMAGGAAWPVQRCGDGVPAATEEAASAAVDAACVRLVIRDRGGYHPGGGYRALATDSSALRLARAVLPGLEGLQGLVGSGGFGVGLGGELQLVRGAHMMLHLAAPHDTRIADSAFAPETTVLARCAACWVASDAIGDGVASGPRRARSSTPGR